jgi:hypothetical protein
MQKPNMLNNKAQLLFQLRLLASCLATMGGTLNLKEMLFVAVSWLPKATVQVPSTVQSQNYKYVCVCVCVRTPTHTHISQSTGIEECWLQGDINHVTLVCQKQNFLPCREDMVYTFHIIRG